MEHVVVLNLSPRIRRAKLNGREYLVAPLTLIVPGVLNGSKGPLLYTADEIQKTVKAWNNMPLSLGHPTGSARNPVTLDSRGLGYVFNASFRNNRLVAEGWFDEAACKRIDQRVLDLLTRGEKIELSTGLDAEAVPVENEDQAHLNGKVYTHVVRNFRPDHVAILLDEKGACSTEDGCGVNNKRKESQQAKSMWRKLGETLGILSPEESTEVSNEDIPELTPAPTHLINADGSKEEINQTVLNKASPENREGENTMREQTINWLVTNCDCWKGKQKVLENKEAFSDEDLTKLKTVAEKGKENEIIVNAFHKHVSPHQDPEKTPPTPPAQATPAAPVENAPASSRLTPEEQEDLAFARQEKQRRKDAMISKLVQNVAEDRKQAHIAVLNKKSLAELELDLERLPPQVQNQRPHERNLDTVSARFGMEPIASTPVRNAEKEKRDIEDMDPDYTINYAALEKKSRDTEDQDVEEMAAH